MADTNVGDSFKKAFLSLFQKVHYDDISVSAICAEAKASRTAFYKYYANKNELLGSILSDDLIEPMQSFRRTAPAHKFPGNVASWVDYMQYDRVLSKRDFYKKIFRECPYVALKSMMTAYTELNKEHLSSWQLDAVESDYVAIISAAIQVVGIAKWVHDDFNFSPEELARLHYKWGVRNWIDEYRKVGPPLESSTGLNNPSK